MPSKQSKKSKPFSPIIIPDRTDTPSTALIIDQPVGIVDFATRYRKGQRNGQGYTICGAPMPDGLPCQNTLLEPSGRCRQHVFWEMTGSVSPDMISRYGGDIPSDLVPRYAKALDDPDLLDIKENIRILDLFIARLLRDLSENVSGEDRSLRKSLYALKKLVEDDEIDIGQIQETLNNAITVFEDRTREAKIRHEIIETQESRARLVDRQERREQFLQQYIQVDKLMTIIRMLREMMLRVSTEMFGKEKAEKFILMVNDQLNQVFTMGSKW